MLCNIFLHPIFNFIMYLFCITDTPTQWKIHKTRRKTHNAKIELTRIQARENQSAENI